MMVGGGSNSGSSPGPITAPAAPRRIEAPHNLYTLEEVAAALRLLKEDARDLSWSQVQVGWRNGGSRSLPIDDLAQITDLEDVRTVFMTWTYSDDSRVTGYLIRQPDAGALSVTGAGRALAATHSALDYLSGLRPQRARVRRLLAGPLPLLVYIVLCIAWLAGLILSVEPQELSRAVPRTSAMWKNVLLGTAIGIPLALLFNRLFALLRRRIGGTRLARTHQVNRRLLTPELNVLVAIVAAAIALLALIATVLR